MENNIQKTARLTGLLYLLVIICAGFAQGYVRGTLVIPNDANATLTNILNAHFLFRFGLVADLVAFMLDAVISILLFQLLKDTNKTIAMVSSAFRLIAHPAIASINLVNHYMALKVTEGNVASSELAGTVMDFMTAHTTGYLIAGAFFGVHCLLLGILLYKSGYFPSILGILMVLAAGGYLIETFGNFLFPGNEMLLATIVGISAAIGEITLTFYLLIAGTRKQLLN
ncbi:MAG: DUF4386 domain-containing protein [Fulvivirga sp.]|uniref:DUF4386 domain-containing protein n=1 Tax=Fulvivirga sp. TaxID=1931237 RepID=UPI0032EDF388